jgi:competence protein ComEC
MRVGWSEIADPLVWPVAGIAAGIGVGRFVAFEAPELLAATAAFLALGGVALWRRARVLAGVCCLLGFVSAGALTALAHAPGPPPELDVSGREIVILGGCVVEPPAISGERERFILELEPGARAQVTLYTKDGASLPRLRYGQKIELDARVRQPRNYGNPGAFDYRRSLAREAIYWTASGAAESLRILPGSCGSPVRKAAMDLRAAILDRTERLYAGSDYETGMTQALLIGQNYQLQRIWTEQYRNTGTFHVLVISGTHVAILAAFFLFLLRICFVPEMPALATTVLAAWLYAMVTGGAAPCVRSAAGLTLAAVCRYFYRDRRPINLLAGVALAFLVFDPEQLFDASFQLTFLAVAFLGLFAAPMIRATSGPLGRGLAELTDTGRDMHIPPRVAQFRIEMRLLAETLRRALRLPARAARLAVTVPAQLLFFFWEVTLVSAVVQAGIALPMVIYFHRIGITGLSANAFAVPIMGLEVPVGFVAVATGWHWVARIGAALLGLSRAIVGWHARIDPDWRVPMPPLWLAVAFPAALIAVAAAPGRRWRALAVTAAAALLVLLVWNPFPPLVHAGQLEMSTIDVGQGDSILLVFPNGQRMLVDGGGIPAFGHQTQARLDIGEDVVAPYLWERRFHTIDVMVLSHAHEDHAGGLPALIADFRPRELWTGLTPESPAWDAVRAAAVRNGTRIVPLEAPRRMNFGGDEIEVLAPVAGYTPSDVPKNNDSLVLEIRHGRHEFLLSGDIESGIERRILEDGGMRPANVLKVAHHGSRTSSTPAFLDAAAPAFAVISVGFENSYRHPNREVLERLAERHAMSLRTDEDGLVTILSDGRRLAVETPR